MTGNQTGGGESIRRRLTFAPPIWILQGLNFQRTTAPTAAEAFARPIRGNVDMRNFLTIARREFTHLAYTPAIYCVLAAITLFYSFVFYSDLEMNRQSSLQPAAIIFGFLSLIVVPVLTMRSFAGEEAGGTIELLLTAPVKAWQVVAGKFAGCWAFYLVTMLPLLGYAAIFAVYGEVDYGETAGIFLGLVLCGAAQVATGLLVSSLTGNVIVAAAGGCVANVFLFMLSLPVERGAGVYSFPASLSWWAHMKEVFAKGILDTRSLVYFASFLLLILFLNWLSLTSRGLFSPGGRRVRTRTILASVACVTAGVNLFIFGGLAHYGWRGLTAAIASGEAFSKGWAVLAGFALVVLGLAVLGFDRAAKTRATGAGTPNASGAAGEGFSRRWPVWLAALAALLLFADVNYLSMLRRADLRLSYRWDLTQNRTNTLTPALRDAADLLQHPLTVTVFFSEGAEYDGQPLARRVRDLLGDLSSYSPLVKARFLDAQADAEQARDEAARLGLQQAGLDKVATLEYQGRMMVLPAAAFLRVPDSQEMMAGRRRALFQGELAMTMALRRMSDERVTRVLFTAGHGEMSISKAGRDPQLAGMLAETLVREAYEVRPWLFTGEEEVPAGTDMLVLAGPVVPFTGQTGERLRKYADGGGRLLLLLPPLMQAKSVPGLEEFLEYFGIKMRDDVVVDDKNNSGGQPTQILTLLEEGADVRTGKQQTLVMLPDARSLAISEEVAKGNNWFLTHLLRSVKDTSKRYNPETKKLLPGPATVGVTLARPAQDRTPEARVVVIGSSAMASNLHLDNSDNELFLAQCCRWLAGREYGVRPQEREYRDLRININADGLRLVWCIAVILLPLGWLLCAVGVWVLRRD